MEVSGQRGVSSRPNSQDQVIVRASNAFLYFPSPSQNRDSSVSIALGYGLDDQGPRVRFPAEVGNFSFHHHVQNGSGAHPASYPVGTKGSFPGGKAAGTWS
jgi:hypothetical protein